MKIRDIETYMDCECMLFVKPYSIKNTCLTEYKNFISSNLKFSFVENCSKILTFKSFEAIYAKYLLWQVNILN